MAKFILTTFAAIAFAGPALADSPIDFTWEGHQIVGTVGQVGNVQILKGRDRSTGQTFELHVSKNYVTGTIGDERVSYPVPRRKVTTVATAG